MTKAEKIRGKILELVQTDVFPVGSRLPSERKLSLQLETSRNTLRGAIKKLEAIGILELRGGSGCYVRSKDDSVQKWQEIRENTSDENIQGWLEAAYLFEPAIGALAARRIQPVDFEDLESCIVALSKAIIEGHSRVAAAESARFHGIIARSTGNRVLMLMTRQFDPANTMAAKWIGRLDEKEREHFFADHVEIFQALRSRDAEMVRKAVAAYLLRMGACLEKYAGIELPETLAEARGGIDPRQQ